MCLSSYDIGPNANPVALFCACPMFRFCDKFCADSRAALSFSDNQAPYFRKRFSLQCFYQGNVNPTQQSTALCHENLMMPVVA